MKIAIVGPSHPYKGGIVQHTTELVHRLIAAGHEVALLSWKNQYPFFYPGVQFVPDNKPELSVPEGIRRVLSWKNPVGWVREIRKYRKYDKIIFVWWVPTIQGPVYLSMLLALGRKRALETTLLCHNVASHEARLEDNAILKVTKAVMKRVDRILVHTAAQADLAQLLTTNTVLQTDLPPVILRPSSTELSPRSNPESLKTLLFFGIVRKYKGLDVLLRAIADVPDIKLIVAGEFWGSQNYDKLILELDLSNRVTLHKGYVATEDMAGLFAAADALVLPYRGGTASFLVSVSHSYGLPVIATTAGSFKSQVRDGVDGLLCEPENIDSLVASIRHFYEPGVALKLRHGVRPLGIDQAWQKYVNILTTSV